MSFEGYYQRLCKKGHAWQTDVYWDNKECPFCQTKCIWENLVDTTNDEGHPILLKLKKSKICSHCKTVLECFYHIPKEK